MRSLRCLVLTCFIFVTLCPPLVNVKIIDSTLLSSTTWKFLFRFCFAEDISKVIYEVYYQLKYCPLKSNFVESCQFLVFYYDNGVWEDVYDNSRLTCDEKTSPDLVSTSQILYLDPHRRYGLQTGNHGHTDNCDLIENGTLVKCTAVRSFNSQRPRWWYAVIANCDKPDLGLSLISYNFTLLNGETYQKHFSYDEFYILEISAIACFIFLIMFFYSLLCCSYLKSKHLLHPTYIVYFCSVVFELLSWMINLAAYLSYQRGYEVLPAKHFGLFVGIISHFLMMTLVLLLAKGYTVTRGSLTTKSFVKLTIFLSFYMFFYILAFFWFLVIFDEAIVRSFYESIPGIVISCLKLVAMIMMIISTAATLKKYPSKKSFYIPFLITYCFWLLIDIISIIMAIYAIQDWNRAKVMTFVEFLKDVFVYGFFGYLTYPGLQNRNFPWHVKTNAVVNASNAEDPHGGDYPQEETEVDSGFVGDGFRPLTDIFNVEIQSNSVFQSESRINSQTALVERPKTGQNVDKVPQNQPSSGKVEIDEAEIDNEDVNSVPINANNNNTSLNNSEDGSTLEQTTKDEGFSSEISSANSDSPEESITN